MISCFHFNSPQRIVFNGRVTWSLALCLLNPFSYSQSSLGCDCREILNSLRTFSVSWKVHSMRIMWQIKWPGLSYDLMIMSSERKWMSRNVLIIILQEESHVKHKLVMRKGRVCRCLWGKVGILHTQDSTRIICIVHQADVWECEMPEIGSSDNDRNVDSADIQSQVEFSGHGQNDPPIFPPLYQTDRLHRTIHHKASCWQPWDNLHRAGIMAGWEVDANLFIGVLATNRDSCCLWWV